MTLKGFVEKWTHPDYLPTPVLRTQLQATEVALGLRLPTEYIEAVLEVGLPWPTIALLDAIVDQELDLHAVSDFFSPAEMAEQTRSWRELGLPGNLVAFASDGIGNMFCFNTESRGVDLPPSSAVWFFDHDFGTVEEIAPNFSAWIDRFCAIEPPVEGDAS